MNITWKNTYTPRIVTDRLEAIKEIKEGNAVFHGYGFTRLTVLAHSMVDFPHDLPEVDGRHIIECAAFAAGSRGEITPQALIADINRLYKDRQKISPEVHVLRTQLSIDPTDRLLFPVFCNDVSIATSILNEPAFIDASKELLRKASHCVIGDEPADYMTVYASTLAKTPNEALDKSLNALDLVRGIWNLLYNRSRGIRMTFGGRTPVNPILTGAFHTLHKEDGRLAATTWWYDPTFVGPQKLHRFGDDLLKVKKFYTAVTKLLGKSSYRGDLETAIVRYVRSLDDRDWNSAFLRLWGVIELLTNTIRASNDLATKRTAFICKDREYHHHVLNHLRDFRNRSVHAGAENSEIEVFMYQLKHYVEHLIQWHLTVRPRFTSIAEAAEFLDSPCDVDALSSKIRKLQRVRRYLTRSPLGEET